MKRTNKKGFTIVELVIVIAVVAILAAVLIPTFVSLVNKANESADIQAARQMNDAVAVVAATDNPTFEQVIGALVEAGYNADDTLVPVSKDYAFHWYSTYKTIVLTDASDAVIFPDDDDVVANFASDAAKTGAEQVVYDLAAGQKFIPAGDITTSGGLSDAIANGKENVSITDDIEVGSKLVIDEEDKITLDLGGKTLSTAIDVGNGTGKHVYAFENFGTLEITNGIIDARGIYNHGTIILGENVTVNAIDNNGGACVWNYAGGEVIINNGTFTAPANPAGASVGTGIISNYGKVTINDGDFTSASSACYAINSHGGSELVINGGTFIGERTINFMGDKLTITGGTFIANSADSAYALMIQSGTEINISGATFDGAFRDVAIVTGIEVTFNGVTFTASAADVVDENDDLVLDHISDGTNPDCHLYNMPEA